ncbi:hypothetical protein [Catelliglobosispora koreensis]|uniref:hypothetical protein n=1 Tax=Catelliglobosispora koreensis TaxID=129052 RepID=UPI000362C38D|nr:hypothetical protein [Catelliglobosispora koreensis]
MTEAIAEDLVLDSEANVLHRVYLSTIDEVVEHARAADTLGLGFRIESYNVKGADDADAAEQSEFEFTLMAEPPVRTETEY